MHSRDAYNLSTFDSEASSDECKECIKESTLNSQNNVDCAACKRSVKHTNISVVALQLIAFKKDAKKIASMSHSEIE